MSVFALEFTQTTTDWRWPVAIDLICAECHRLCNVYEQCEIDHEPFGDQIVERRSYYVLSVCCDEDVLEVDVDEVIH